MSKKENKKIAIKFIIPLAVVLLLILGWVLFLNIWAVKPSNEIRSIKFNSVGKQRLFGRYYCRQG